MEKYFRSGHPDRPGLPHIGLYSPIFDCFVITVGLEPLAWQLKSLLSSRYSLYPMYLNTADNYRNIKIDNHNCIKWTATNAKSINLLREFIDTPSHSCNYLISAESQSLDININDEKHWAWLCLYWLITIERFKNNKPHYTQADNNINRFLDLPNLSYKVDLYQAEEKQILKLLYLGREFDSTAQEVEKIGRVFL